MTTVTRTSTRGPPTGGLGAIVAACLTKTWKLQGPEEARLLFQKLLLLPPAGGDMYRAMIDLEMGRFDVEDDSKQQTLAVLPKSVVQRVRKVYESWVDAYGSEDVSLWVEYALFEQGFSKQGAGKVYYKAVKQLADPDGFIQQYRSRIGAE